MNTLSVPTLAKQPYLDLETAATIATYPVIPEVIEPYVQQAEIQLIQVLSHQPSMVSESAFQDFLNSYRQNIARLTNLVILQRFTSFHLNINPLWRPKRATPGQAEEGSQRDILDYYIAWEEIEKLLEQDGPYPELAKLVHQMGHNWLTSIQNILHRVQKHQLELASILTTEPHALQQITGAKFGISDPHNNGQTAAILSFGQQKIVYKPRSLDGEEGWNALMDKIVKQGLKQAIFLPKIIRGHGYGFMEFVPTTTCQSPQEVKECYTRYGAILAIAHALGTCDLHHENIIVSGAFPVVVDAEPLFRARLAISNAGDDRLKFEKNLSLEGLEVRESVLELGILPLVMKSPLKNEDNETIQQENEIGALCAYGKTHFTDMLPCAIGSNHLQIRPVEVIAHTFPNLPTLHGQAEFPEQYIDAILAGFQETHQYLAAHQEEFLKDDGYLETFSKFHIRMLVRPTMDYVNILSRSLSPEVLANPTARKELIQSDLQATAEQRMDTINDLTNIELNSLLQADIPLFELPSDSVIYEDAKLLTTPLICAKDRWKGMDDFDCALQMTSIRERLLKREAAVTNLTYTTTEKSLLEHGCNLVKTLVEAAGHKDGAAFWTYTSYAPGFAATMAHTDRESLYEGCAGTALVVAEAGKLTGKQQWMDLAVSVFLPLMKGQVPTSITRSGGMARGLGGLIYAMQRTAVATNCAELLQTATQLALTYAPDLGKKDGLDEILYGRAGLLLALLSLYNVAPTPSLLVVMDDIAALLIDRATTSTVGVCWPVPSGNPMPHASHGSAGIAMALARWATLRKNTQARHLAIQALQFDDQFWREEEAGWVDARFLDLEREQRTNWSWCNGRSGALLTRLAVAEALGNSFENEFTNKALQASQTDIITDVSSGLCCGTPGAIDALLKIQELHFNTTLEQSIQAATNILATQTPCSHYSTLTSSLFTGSAGLAYGLLRAAAPSVVKSVLWFE
ncbi:MAG: type 2 lanthipeptide synthetase LanM [Aureispira sp.]